MLIETGAYSVVLTAYRVPTPLPLFRPTAPACVVLEICNLLARGLYTGRLRDAPCHQRCGLRVRDDVDPPSVSPPDIEPPDALVRDGVGAEDVLECVPTKRRGCRTRDGGRTRVFAFRACKVSRHRHSQIPPQFMRRAHRRPPSLPCSVREPTTRGPCSRSQSC